jgi:hypothetical protein
MNFGFEDWTDVVLFLIAVALASAFILSMPVSP